MARRSEKLLTQLQCKNAKGPAILADGGGLSLVVEASGTKRWELRTSILGKRRQFGLGSYPATSLEDARAKAADIRKAARNGIDLRKQAAIEALKGTTFKSAFEEFLEDKKRELGNQKHIWQWERQMELHIYPSLGDRPVAEITAKEIIDALRPIWFEIPETAMRLLQRMKSVFDAAIVAEIREKANPCTGVAAVLGKRHRVVEHYTSLPYSECPRFMAQLQGLENRRWPVVSLALEFLILNASRAGEVRGATWSEFDLDARLWSIPKERMKVKQPHRVPLSSRAMALLEEAKHYKREESDLVFPAQGGGKLSDMTLTKVLRDMEVPAVPHGFRSSFKGWCAEVAKVADEVSEAALAHAVRGKVKAAYLRVDFLDERRALMEAWASFLSSD